MNTYPTPNTPLVELEHNPRKVTTKKQGGISLTRLFIAMLTLGISIPFIGLRRVKRTTTRIK